MPEERAYAVQLYVVPLPCQPCIEHTEQALRAELLELPSGVFVLSMHECMTWQIWTDKTAFHQYLLQGLLLAFLSQLHRMCVLLLAIMYPPIIPELFLPPTFVLQSYGIKIGYGAGGANQPGTIKPGETPQKSGGCC